MYCIHCMEIIEDGTNICPKCNKSQKVTGATEEYYITPGTFLENGRYFIGDPIGEGNFGITYIGIDTRLDSKIAVKEYYPKSYSKRNNTIDQTVSSNSSNH